MKTIMLTAAAIALGALGANATFTTSADAGQWKRCAQEGGYCSVPQGTTNVRYGLGSSWSGRSVKGNGKWCTNEAFRYDPAPGRRKVCEYYQPDWVRCNHEGGGCTVRGTGWILYGAGNQTTMKYFQPGARITCSNATFGDPAPGRRKECWFYR